MQSFGNFVYYGIVLAVIRCILKNSYNFVIELSHRGME